MNHQQVNLEPHKLLEAILENLNSQFFAGSRANAKRLFKAIAAGEQVPFMHISFAGAGDIDCNLALDCSHYAGKLTFGNFRQCLAMMLQGISNRLKIRDDGKQDLNIMNSDEGDVLFHIPGVIHSADGINILVSGLRQQGPGEAIVRLMFLDPKQYPTLEQAAQDDSTSS